MLLLIAGKYSDHEQGIQIAHIAKLTVSLVNWVYFSLSVRMETKSAGSEVILTGTKSESNRGIKIVDFLDGLLNIPRLDCFLNLHPIRDGRQVNLRCKSKTRHSDELPNGT